MSIEVLEIAQFPWKVGLFVKETFKNFSNIYSYFVLGIYENVSGNFKYQSFEYIRVVFHDKENNHFGQFYGEIGYTLKNSDNLERKIGTIL